MRGCLTTIFCSISVCVGSNNLSATMGQGFSGKVICRQKIDNFEHTLISNVNGKMVDGMMETLLAVVENSNGDTREYECKRTPVKKNDFGTRVRGESNECCIMKEMPGVLGGLTFGCCDNVEIKFGAQLQNDENKIHKFGDQLENDGNKITKFGDQLKKNENEIIKFVDHSQNDENKITKFGDQLKSDGNKITKFGDQLITKDVIKVEDKVNDVTKNVVKNAEDRVNDITTNVVKNLEDKTKDVTTNVVKNVEDKVNDVTKNVVKKLEDKTNVVIKVEDKGKSSTTRTVILLVVIALACAFLIIAFYNCIKSSRESEEIGIDDVSSEKMY